MMSEMYCWKMRQNGDYYYYGWAAVGVRHKVYSFGGYIYGSVLPQMDVHVFNTVSLRCRKLTPVMTGRDSLEVPSARLWHTAVLIEDIVYIWGGCHKELCNILYAFDVDTHRWFKPLVSGTVPEPRYCHSACVLRKVMYVYGGCLDDGDSNQIYKLDTNTMVWTLLDTSGIKSFPHSATIIGTRMFVFDGRLCVGNSIRVFDTETNSWMNTRSAELPLKGRWYHGAFSYNGELYIFGGRCSEQDLNDLWKFNPETFSWNQVEPKGKRLPTMSKMCCCMVGDRIVLIDRLNAPDDLYILDLSPSLKTLCKLAVIQYHLEQAELPHDIRWELRAMTANRNRKINKNAYYKPCLNA